MKKRKPQTVAYMRVSTRNQTIESQKASIFEYANKHGIKIHKTVEVESISAKMDEDRRKITELKSTLRKGDTLLVAELDRLGRSIHQIVNLVNWLTENEVNFIVCNNDQIRLRAGEDDFVTKILTTIFGVLAEVEHKVLKDRITAGVALAKERGVQFGRKAGTKLPSKLDGKEETIRSLVDMGIPKTRIAKDFGVSRTALNHWIKTRKVLPPISEKAKRGKKDQKKAKAEKR